MQASELQEINKLIKEAERLRAMADTASITVSDAEDCGSEDDSRAVNSVQASELQEINKLIKDAERLRAMADTAGIAVSDAEDCGSEDDSRSTKGAAVNRSRSSLSKSKTSPSKSYLLAAAVQGRSGT